jgi:hypothetical protein
MVDVFPSQRTRRKESRLIIGVPSRQRLQLTLSAALRSATWAAEPRWLFDVKSKSYNQKVWK